jgi:hypothetical protein
MAENSGEAAPQADFEVVKGPVEGHETIREKALEHHPQSEATQARQSPQFNPPTTVQTIPVIDTSSDHSAHKAGKPITSDLDAAEADQIEKQWIQSAKSIVAQTQDDPYNQKKQMSRIKADYIKKRFDKTIPADDAVAT